MSEVKTKPVRSGVVQQALPGVRPAWRWLAGGALVVACAALSLPAVVRAQGFGPGPMHGGPGGPGMMFGGGAPEHAARRIDRMLDGLNVSDAQRAQIRQIVQAAATDLRAQRDSARSLRERGVQLFGAPTVDANAAEALRQQMLAQQDQASRRMLQAMLDVSRVLTPEQRAKMAERVREREAVMRDRMQRMQREHGPRGAASQPRP